MNAGNNIIIIFTVIIFFVNHDKNLESFYTESRCSHKVIQYRMLVPVCLLDLRCSI